MPTVNMWCFLISKITILIVIVPKCVNQKFTVKVTYYAIFAVPCFVVKIGVSWFC